LKYNKVIGSWVKRGGITSHAHHLITLDMQMVFKRKMITIPTFVKIVDGFQDVYIVCDAETPIFSIFLRQHESI
jgi:hypothetical protein